MRVKFVEYESVSKNADGMRVHLESVGASNHVPSVDERIIKRALGLILRSA